MLPIHITKVLYHRTSRLKVRQMYKTIHCDAPDYLTTSFTFTSEIHTRLLRSSSTYHLYTPRPRHEIYRHSFTYSGASVWNSLPVSSKTHQMSNSSKVYIWGCSEILPHKIVLCNIRQTTENIQCILNCEFNVMTVLVYPIWFCTCIPDICCSITLIWYWDQNTHL